MKTYISALLLTALTACGTAPQSSASKEALNSKRTLPAKTVAFDTGSFKLYKTPDFTPDPQCDEFIRLVLVNGFTGPLATLEQGAEGPACGAPQPDDHHAYNVRPFYLDSCQSKIYRGERDDGAKIEVIDHRQRNCGDTVPAKIIVNEKMPEGLSRTLYIGAGQLDENHEVLKGVMVTVSAIGGETSGYALQLENGSLIELNMATNSLTPEFKEGRQVIVEGHYAAAHGIENPIRKVFVVEKVSDVVIN